MSTEIRERVERQNAELLDKRGAAIQKALQELVDVRLDIESVLDEIQPNRGDVPESMMSRLLNRSLGSVRKIESDLADAIK